MAELTPVTFKDVAVCFSEDEWRLLAAWEKQLYKNVMREIHGALISLGYAIVNPDIVFRIKKSEVPYPWVQSPQKGRDNAAYSTPGCPLINPDLLLRVTRVKEPSGRTRQAESGESSACPGPSADHPVVTSAIPIKVKREEDPHCMKRQDHERPESINPTLTHPVVTSVFSLRVKQEEETFCTDFRPFERGKGINSPTSNNPIVNPDVLFQVPQGESDFMSCRISRGTPAAKNESTTGSWLANQNFEEDEILELRRMFPEKSNDSPLQDHGMGFPIKGKISIKREMKKVGQQEYKFVDHGKSLHQWIAPIVQLEAHMQDSPLAHDVCLKRSRSPPNWSIYQKTQRVDFLHKCTDCTKSFFEESKLLMHRRTHLGDRPYQCSECTKFFRNKYCLLKHWRIHTGEKPYKCTNCERTFTQDSSLLVHQRTHNGERPYKCPECEKCFTCSSNLIRHRKTHRGAFLKSSAMNGNRQ